MKDVETSVRRFLLRQLLGVHCNMSSPLYTVRLGWRIFTSWGVILGCTGMSGGTSMNCLESSCQCAPRNLAVSQFLANGVKVHASHVKVIALLATPSAHLGESPI